jgi:SNF2 family DNA or RNA helicase
LSLYSVLYGYQRSAVDFALEREGSCIFAEQGTGKTYILGGIVERMHDDVFCGLIIVPLANIATTWERMFRERLPQVPLSRSWAAFKAGKKRGVLLLHYESIDKRLIAKLRKVQWSLVAYDESQRIKGRGTAQSRNAAKLRHARRRVLLSGTPIEQSPQDLWAQFRFACPDVFGTKWAPFEDRWLRKTGFMGHKLEFKKHLLPKFLTLIKPHILRVKKEDVLDLPLLTYKRVPVSLLGEQARVYADLECDMMTTVNGRVVIADMAITQLVRLQQVCGGFVRCNPTPEQRAEALASGRKRRPRGEVVYVGEAKLRKLRTIVRAAGRPLVVFCKYLEEVEQVRHEMTVMGLKTAVVTGKTKKTRTRTIEQFQRGIIDVLVCQIKTGGVGIDLFAANVAIIYSMTHSYIDFDQALARIHRIGQTRPVTIYLLYVLNAVDADIYSLILSKKSVSEQVLNKGRKRWRS